MPTAARILPAFASTVFCGAVPFVRGGSAAPLPQRVKILAWGENLGRTTKARIVVGEKTASCLSANQVATACERVPLDYEHQSVPGHPNFVPDPRQVPGHGSIEIVPNDGVYLSAIDFTSSGNEFAANYQDVSAVAYLDAESNLLFIRSVALTQHGDVAGMEFSESVAASAQFSPAHPTPPTMLDYKLLLCQVLGLAATAADAEITTAVTTEKAEPDAVALAATAAAAAAAAAPVPDATMVALSAEFDSFRRQAAIDKALAQGKAIPLTDAVLATLPMAALNALLTGLPAGAVATAGSGSKEVAAAKVVALSADQTSAAKALGLTEEEFRAGLPNA